MGTELTQNCYTVNIREDGTTLVRGFFRYPSLSEHDIYTELAKNSEEWLRSSLAPKAVQEYSQDPSPKKRFCFSAYEYRFEVACLSRDENEMHCRLTATLSRRGEKIPLSKYESTDRLRLPDLVLLPSKKKTKTKIPST